MPLTKETNRLILKSITPEVYDDLFSRNNNDEIKRVLGLQDDDTLEKYRDNYKKGMSCYSLTFLYFTIHLKEHPEQAIGTCGYYRIHPQHSRGEVGYVLNEDKHKRKGYTSEALTAIIDYGFNKLNFHRIEAFVAPDNQASLGLIKKFGFKEEGCLKQHYLYNGEYQDSLVFGLIRPK